MQTVIGCRTGAKMSHDESHGLWSALTVVRQSEEADGGAQIPPRASPPPAPSWAFYMA